MIVPHISHENATKKRRGLSLLEVVLALVILASSMVAIGQLMMIGARHSTTVQEQARGLQYVQSLLDSVAVGVIPMESTGFTPIETDPEWQYSLDVQVNSVEGLNVVVATVEIGSQMPFQVVGGQSATASSAATKPSTVQLTRWIVDPIHIKDRMLNQATIDDAIIEAMIQAEAEAEEGAEAAPAGGGR